ncbi:hypothetical protein EGW08_017376, partial [Elysia chlorotica]
MNMNMSTPSLTDRIFTERLIEEVKSHPVLYNPRQPGYKDRFTVDAAWKVVADNLGCRAHSAKKRWQNLRGSYSRSMANQNLPSEYGAPSGKKKLQFFMAQQMSFLEPHMQNGINTSHTNSNSSSEWCFSKTEPVWDESSLESAGQDDVQQTTTATLIAHSPGLPTPTPGEDPAESLESTVPPEALGRPAHGGKRTITTNNTWATGTKTKRSFPGPEMGDLFKVEKAARFLEPETNGYEYDSVACYNKDMESLRGLLPHMATLSRRGKRNFLRKTYNLLFEMVEEEEE